MGILPGWRAKGWLSGVTNSGCDSPDLSTGKVVQGSGYLPWA